VYVSYVCDLETATVKRFEAVVSNSRLFLLTKQEAVRTVCSTRSPFVTLLSRRAQSGR